MSEIPLKISIDNIHCYPEPAKLYYKLSEIDGLSPESFILTPGSDGAINSTFNVFLNKDDKVIITKPTLRCIVFIVKFITQKWIILNMREI